MWKDFWALYWKRLIGAAVGLFFGIIYLAFGFWNMLFVALLVGIGYWIGKEKEMSSGQFIPIDRIWQFVTRLFRPYR